MSIIFGDWYEEQPEWKVVAWKDTDGLLDWVEFEYGDDPFNAVRLVLADGDSKRKWPAWKIAEWLGDNEIRHESYYEEPGVVEGSAIVLPLEEERNGRELTPSHIR